MDNLVRQNPTIFHVVHSDRLSSIVSDAFLWSDAYVTANKLSGTMIGMSHIKERRLRNQLSNHLGLTVGQCVPFYFCPRSVMLFTIAKRTHQDIQYQGGQESIIHLKADLYKSVQWATLNNKRWCFTLSNAGATYFEDRADLSQLSEINWSAVEATQWSQATIKEGKQAEFLMEEKFPWQLVEEIGVYSTDQQQLVNQALQSSEHRPPVCVRTNWYY